MPSLESVDLLIEARWVLPIAPVNTALAHHAVAVRDGRIVALGPAPQLLERFEPRERVQRATHALLPGFVNAHTRAATTLLRGLPVYGPRQRWMQTTVRPAARAVMSPDFVRAGTQLAIAEMLRAGITSFADMYLFPEEAARVASAARVRAAIGLPVTDGPTVWAENATGHLAKAERLWDEYRADPWVSLYFAPHDALGENDQTLARVRRVADELDARVALYLAPGETAADRAQQRSPLGRLRELGLLRPGFTAIHLGELDAAAMEMVAATGISVVACQQAHLRLGEGPSPILALAARGVPVALGTDSALAAGALDMLAEARLAALLAGSKDCGEPIADTVLRIATLGGASVLGLNALIGSVEPGKAADLVCIDLAALGSQSHSRPADALVFGATRHQVTDVWTAGRPAIRAGHLLTFDEQELLSLASRWAGRLPAGANA